MVGHLKLPKSRHSPYSYIYIYIYIYNDILRKPSEVNDEEEELSEILLNNILADSMLTHFYTNIYIYNI